jgi:hypothetical protein
LRDKDEEMMAEKPEKAVVSKEQTQRSRLLK